MKNIFINILLTILFLLGLGILLYPTVSDIVNTEFNEKRIASYEKAVEDMSLADYSSYFEKAMAYNEKIKRHIKINENEYENQLNVDNSGIMGYIEIPKIDVKLPIFHGVDSSVLQIGIGHLKETTLPIGGKGTHSALSGHRGLPSAKLFTELDELEIGDTFNIYILDKSLSYQIDNIIVVEPNDASSLGIIPDKDYVTLITCTPYGINTQRLLVRGTRVEYKKNDKKLVYNSEADIIDPNKVALILGVIIWVILFIIGLVINNKNKKLNIKGGNYDEG
ncbi:MAG: class C sortase [Lachnospirales bacterium]